MKYTTNQTIFEIGDKIYPADLSNCHSKSDNVERDSLFIYTCFNVDDKIKKGNPLVVVSKPYAKFNVGIMEHEFYIDVKFEDDDTIYCIMNFGTHVFKTYGQYCDYIAYRNKENSLRLGDRSFS